MGDLVGALVELRVAELPLVEDDGNRIGIALHLLLEELVRAQWGKFGGP